jgi:hypothetical protein
MRYADGGLTAQGRLRREQARLQAAETFAHDGDAGQGREVAEDQHEVGLPMAPRQTTAWRLTGGSRTSAGF